MTKAMKPASLAERLARACDISNEINAATDALNDELADLQKKFADLRLGVEAGIHLETTVEEDAHGYLRMLWFEKVNADWLFTIRKGQEENLGMTPLLKAAKQLRLESAHKMPELLEALITHAEKQVEEVEEATDVVRGVARMVDQTNRGKQVTGLTGEPGPSPAYLNRIADGLGLKPTSTSTAEVAATATTAKSAAMEAAAARLHALGLRAAATLPKKGGK
jgi:hypothetical protein